MKTDIFLAALPSHDNRLNIAQKILACEAKRSPLIRIQWSYPTDLHITLGYIAEVEEKEVRLIGTGFASLIQTAPFMAHTEEVKIYGNAVILKVEPYQQFLSLHKKMNQKLIAVADGHYQFQVSHRYDSHLTIGRIKNVHDLNPLHKHQLISLIQEQFKNCSFLIQQAALLQRLPQATAAAYQNIQLYALRG